jgi:ketosteroid isomerase-like protein
VSAADTEAVALVRRAFDLYEAGEFDALFALAHPEVEVDPVFVPQVYRGVPAVRSLFENEGDPRRRWTATDLEFHDVQGMAVVTGRLHALASLGAALNLPIAFLFVVRDHVIVRFEGHMTKQQAVRSAGDLADPTRHRDDPPELMGG